MSVLVCVPTTGDIRSETAEVALTICANHSGGASFRTIRAHPTDRCRNLCVQEFLQSPHSHLLFLDSDVIPPVDGLELMLSIDRPVVCGIYPLVIESVLCTSVARKLAPDTYGFLHDFPDEPFEIDAAGLDCCLIAREVFQQINDPWFKFDVRPDGHMTGEDIYFFERCAEVGIRPIVIPRVLCAHHRAVDLLGLYQELRVLRREKKLRQAAYLGPSASALRITSQFLIRFSLAFFFSASIKKLSKSVICRGNN